MFVVYYTNGKVSGYVRKHDGMNDFLDDPRLASHYYSKESAESGKVGHHRDMGGSGFRGTIVPLRRATRDYLDWRERVRGY
jgi:hypothetical protein